MSLESATYISDLNVANPPKGDPVGQADDHLRLIKSVLKTTFPNLTGPVTARQDQLSNAMPFGAIIFWSQTLPVPTGWALCNGGTYAKADGLGNVTVPNLLDKMIMGAGGSYALGATGGAAAITPTGTANAYALNINEIPFHGHGVNDPGHAHSVYDPGHSHTTGSIPTLSALAAPGASGYTSPGYTSIGSSANTTGISIYAAGTGISIAGNGGSQAHAHGLTMNSQNNLPPYYALYPIFKL
jgi:hypothetical protein